MKKFNLSPAIIGLAQATGLIAYIIIVGTIMANGNKWFGALNNAGILGPVLFLTLFCFSAIVCAAIMGAYPFYVFWEKKNTNLALKIIFYSTLWLFIFIVLTISVLVYLH